MDAERGGMKAEEPLRSLFKEVGHVQAPADLEERILSKLASQPVASVPAAPLISRPVAIGILIGLLALMALSLFLATPVNGAPTIGMRVMDLVYFPEFHALISSGRLLIVGAGVLVLMGLDRMITKRTRTLFLF